MADSNGFVVIHRRLAEHWVWKGRPYTKGQAWVDILLRVNHAAAKIEVGNTLLELQPGQTLWSIKAMAERWGWSRKKVSGFIHGLTTDDMLSANSTSKYTILTVKNWEKNQKLAHQRNIKGTSKEHQLHTNNNENNDNNENKDTTNVVSAGQIVKDQVEKDIDLLFKQWEKKTGMAIETNVPKNRTACRMLLKKYDVRQVSGLIDIAILAQPEQFAPNIANFIQLREKLQSLGNWFKRQNKSQSKGGVLEL